MGNGDKAFADETEVVGCQAVAVSTRNNDILELRSILNIGKYFFPAFQ